MLGCGIEVCRQNYLICSPRAEESREPSVTASIRGQIQWKYEIRGVCIRVPEKGANRKNGGEQVRRRDGGSKG